MVIVEEREEASAGTDESSPFTSDRPSRLINPAHHALLIKPITIHPTHSTSKLSTQLAQQAKLNHFNLPSTLSNKPDQLLSPPCQPTLETFSVAIKPTSTTPVNHSHSCHLVLLIGISRYIRRIQTALHRCPLRNRRGHT